MKAYIRSYFDGDFKKFKKRFERCKSFLKFFHEHNMPVTILAQCWTDDMVNNVKKEFPRISFDRQEKLGAAGATNYILKNYLYDTNEDYIFLTDDDIFLRTNLGSDYLFKVWHAVESSEIKGHINFLNTAGGASIYLSKYLSRKDILKDNELSSFPLINSKRTFLFTTFLFNTKKHFNKEIYTEDKDGDKVIYDDLLFGNECVLQGINYYVCPLLHAVNKFAIDSVYDRKADTSQKEDRKRINLSISEDTEAFF